MNNNVFAKKELIFEHPGLLDRFTMDFIEHSLIQYPVSYGHTSLWVEDDNDKFFGRGFYWDKFLESFNAVNLPSGVDYLVDFVIRKGTTLIHEDTIFKSIQRVVLNGQTPVNTPKIHIDYNTNTHWSFLYYITSYASGGTMIYDNIHTKNPYHHCEYEQGKLLIFPSCYAHQALPPVERDHWKMSLNIVLEVESPLQSLIRE